MKTWVKILIAVCVLVLLVLVSMSVFGPMTTGNAIFGENSMKEFVKCLNGKGVELFVFNGNPQAKAQLDIFGNYSKELDVIDCHVSFEKCAGVIVYPSWKINERIVSSGLSLGTLSQISGCRLE